MNNPGDLCTIQTGYILFSTLEYSKSSRKMKNGYDTYNPYYKHVLPALIISRYVAINGEAYVITPEGTGWISHFITWIK